MQELTDSIKRPNVRIMGIEEGEEVQAKGMRNIFNKIIMENFQN
jgi:archaeosine-15-forming tRNA-guanine transglycosylase